MHPPPRCKLRPHGHLSCSSHGIMAGAPCVSVSLHFLGYHENGVVKAENGTSPRTKKLKSP